MSACDFSFDVKEELLTLNKQRAILNLAPILTYTVVKTGEIKVQPKDWQSGNSVFQRVDHQAEEREISLNLKP